MNIIEAMEEAKRIGAKGIHCPTEPWWFDGLSARMKEHNLLHSSCLLEAMRTDWEPYTETVSFAEAYIAMRDGKLAMPVGGSIWWGGISGRLGKMHHDIRPEGSFERSEPTQGMIRGQWVIKDGD